MTQAAQKSRKKAKTTPGGLPSRRERRFTVGSGWMPRPLSYVGMLGALVLGAGAYGLWIAEPALEYGSWLLAAGGLAMGASLWLSQPAELAVMVGDGGVALDFGQKIERLYWWELTKIQTKGDKLLLLSESKKLSFSWPLCRPGAAAVLKEAALRRPELLDVPASFTEKLGEPKENEGLLGSIEDQVAGLGCAASGEPIKLEEEARICACCGRVYHKSSVPERCLSCDTPTAGKLLSV